METLLHQAHALPMTLRCEPGDKSLLRPESVKFLHTTPLGEMVGPVMPKGYGDKARIAWSVRLVQ